MYVCYVNIIIIFFLHFLHHLDFSSRWHSNGVVMHKIWRTGIQSTLCKHFEEHYGQSYVHHKHQHDELLAREPVLPGYMYIGCWMTFFWMSVYFCLLIYYFFDGRVDYLNVHGVCIWNRDKKKKNNISTPV